MYLEENLKTKAMGRIEDKHNKNKRKDRDSNPLTGSIGKRDIETNDFDINEKTIKDQQNKK